MKFFLLFLVAFSLSSWATTDSVEQSKRYTDIDFNGDGIADILWRKGSGNYLWYMKSDGKHTYKNIGSKPKEYKIEAIADFNGDGIADILWRKGSGNYLWYMKSDGKHRYKNIGSKSTAYKIEAIADFNADGNADILWKKGSGNYLWYMKSDGKHTYKNIGSKPTAYKVEGVADFNADGNADILWKKESGNYLWYMKSDGKHSYKNIGSKATTYKVAGVADFNADGNADILWRKGSGNYLWYMKSDGKHRYKNIGSKSTAYRVEGVADFNADGNADILWRKGSGNYLWYMKSDGKHAYKNIGSKAESYISMIHQQTDVVSLVKGYLLDAPVEGMEYECNGTVGITSAKGEFSCPSAPVKFYIGSLTVGTLTAFTSDNKVYPQDLLNIARENFDNPELIEMVQLLQSLDDDGNISNSISISSDLKGTFVINVDNFGIGSILSMANKTLVNAEDAINHLKENMAEYVAPIVDDLNLSASKNSSVTIFLNENNVSNLTFMIVKQPQGGTVIVNGDVAIYTPNQNFVGVDSFTYKSNNGKSDSNEAMVTITIDSFKLYSASYVDGGVIPRKHVCSYYRGSNVSPQFSWKNAPIDTSKYAIIMDDEVYPCGSGMRACKHWSLFNIPSSTNELVENFNLSTITGTIEGRNYNGSYDYEGPCPPSSHRYKTTIYALSDAMPDIKIFPSMTRMQFALSYKNYILDSTTIDGIFTP